MTVDMMSTGFHAVELAELGYGETVVIIGIGPVGLMAVAGARLKGAGRIMVRDNPFQ
jgi:threonine dehydrogenase-like Zn-dependent dehydrogenase